MQEKTAGELFAASPGRLHEFCFQPFKELVELSEETVRVIQIQGTAGVRRGGARRPLGRIRHEEFRSLRRLAKVDSLPVVQAAAGWVAQHLAGFLERPELFRLASGIREELFCLAAVSGAHLVLRCAGMQTECAIIIPCHGILVFG